MEKEKDTYWKLIEKLQNNEPILNNPEALTENIMQQIQKAAAKQNIRRRFLFLGWLSGAAAVLLICFFISEQIISAQETPATTMNVTLVSPFHKEIQMLKEKNNNTSITLHQFIQMKENRWKKQSVFEHLSSKYNNNLKEQL